MSRSVVVSAFCLTVLSAFAQVEEEGIDEFYVENEAYQIYNSTAVSSPPVVTGCNIPRPGETWFATMIALQGNLYGCGFNGAKYTFQDFDPVYYLSGQVVEVCATNGMDNRYWYYIGKRGPFQQPTYPSSNSAGICQYRDNMYNIITGDVYYFKRR